jgi:serine/threonine protein kinase
MAPEQAMGQEVDCRADVFALGVILWEVLAGYRLFVAETEMATMRKVIDMAVGPPRSEIPWLPEELTLVCLRALERDPARRYGSARAMRSELEEIAASAGLLATPHEIADAVQALFPQELERRRANIRAFTDAVQAGSAPMNLRDVYHLPALDEPTFEEEPPSVEPPTQKLAEPASSFRRKTKVTPPKPVELDSLDIEPVATPPRRPPSHTALSTVVLLSLLAGAALGLWLARLPASAPETLTGAVAEVDPVPAPVSAPIAPVAPPPAPVTAPPPASVTQKAAPRRPARRAGTRPLGASPIIEENPYTQR